MKDNKAYREEATKCIKAYSGSLFRARALVAAGTSVIDGTSRKVGSALGGLISKSTGKNVGAATSTAANTLTNGAVKIGLARVYTKVAKKEKFTIGSDLFAGLKGRFAYGMRINLILPFYSILYTLIGAAAGAGIGAALWAIIKPFVDFEIKSDDGTTISPIIPLIVAGAILFGSILTVIGQYRYTLTYFVAQDEHLSVQDATDTISEAKRILHGHKMKLFKIELWYFLVQFLILLVGLGICTGVVLLSGNFIIFFVLLLVTFIAFGIASYVLRGRKQVIRALFYLDLSKEKGNRMTKK